MLGSPDKMPSVSALLPYLTLTDSQVSSYPACYALQGSGWTLVSTVYVRVCVCVAGLSPCCYHGDLPEVIQGLSVAGPLVQGPDLSIHLLAYSSRPAALPGRGNSIPEICLSKH